MAGPCDRCVRRRGSSCRACPHLVRLRLLHSQEPAAALPNLRRWFRHIAAFAAADRAAFAAGPVSATLSLPCGVTSLSPSPLAHLTCGRVRCPPSTCAAYRLLLSATRVAGPCVDGFTAANILVATRRTTCPCEQGTAVMNETMILSYESQHFCSTHQPSQCDHGGATSLRLMETLPLPCPVPCSAARTRALATRLPTPGPCRDSHRRFLAGGRAGTCGGGGPS